MEGEGWRRIGKRREEGIKESKKEEKKEWKEGGK